MQGYLQSIARHYLAGMTAYELKKSVTIRDVIKHDSIAKQQQKYIVSSRKEKEMLELSGKIICENDWCEDSVKALNPDVEVYRCPLSINTVFSEKKWNIENVGLSIATLLSQNHEVIAVDIVPEKVDLINHRKSPIQDEYIEKYLAEKDLNLVATLDYIFHAAALKQVPSCEFFPIEAVKTNVLGTENVLTAAIEAGVKKIICLSTDKAAYPVNAMGTSKAMMEKVIVAKSRTVSPEKTSICCTRYGNVLCSRGSVVPLWIEQMKAGNPITITEPSMTRFVMSLEEAVELVVFAFQNAESGDIMVQKAPACTIEVLAQAVKELFHSEDEIKVIGIRHGEKMYETLLTNEECANAIDMGNFYRVPCDKRDLNYDKYFKDGDVERNKLTEFNSNNTDLWTVEQVKAKLMELSYVRDELAKWESR